MAIYGVSFYHRDKDDANDPNAVADVTPYGPDQSIDYDVSPFVAEPIGYSRVRLTWTPNAATSAGPVAEFRLLRNWTGFSVDEQDGEILLSGDMATSKFVDTTVRAGSWHYYSIWARVGTAWVRAGIACTLMTVDHGYGDKMFDLLPLYHQLLQGAVDDLPAVENDTLKTFLQVLAHGLNYLKTYYDTLLVLNDPMKNHLGQLVNLAQQFGIDYLPVTPSHLYRSRVVNAGALARQKGTIEHVRSIIGLTVGWDVEITPGGNLMLNEDAASFVHPIWPDWDPYVNYATGDTVSYNGYTFRAKTGGAYGAAQAPSGTTATNTWWTYLAGTQDTTLVGSDGTVAGWAARSYTSGVTPGPLSAAIGVGVQSPTDTTVASKNVLYLSNTAASSADLGVVSAGGADTDPYAAVTRGVPVPKADRPWDATALYPVGALVSYRGLPYRALQKNEGLAPSGTLANNAFWQCLGFDERVTLTGSLYVKGGLNTYQDRLAYPTVDYYDDKGNLIVSVDTTKDYSSAVFDGFGHGAGVLAGRVTDTGTKTWGEVGTSTWTLDGDGAIYPTQVGTLAYIDGTADGRVSVTFGPSDKRGVSTQAVIVRWSGTALATATYIKATRTGLYATGTLLGTYSTPFSDGDRIDISFVGSTIKVFRNGTQVLTATSTVNQTSTRHGMLVV